MNVEVSLKDKKTRDKLPYLKRYLVSEASKDEKGFDLACSLIRMSMTSDPIKEITSKRANAIIKQFGINITPRMYLEALAKQVYIEEAFKIVGFDWIEVMTQEQYKRTQEEKRRKEFLKDEMKKTIKADVCDSNAH
jgi:hypothetical protein